MLKFLKSNLLRKSKMYKVIQTLVVKVKGEVKRFAIGSIVKLPESTAQMFIKQGKIEPLTEQTESHKLPADKYELAERMAIMGENTEPKQTEPYVTDSGILVIPFNSDKKYHYWNSGQSVCDTLKELGRCDLIEKYKSIYSN